MTDPSPLDYDDYRLFLNEVYQVRKSLRKKFSFRHFASEMGFQASNYLHLVVNGKRNLSDDALLKIQRHFLWRAYEKKYFKFLVLENRSKDDKEKSDYKTQLAKLKKSKRTIIAADQDAYFTNWFIPVLREIVALDGFVSNLNWMARKILPSVPETQIQKGLAVLERLSMIKRVQGKWIQTEAHLTTPAEVTSDRVHHYHEQMLDLSRKSLELPALDRDISAMTMSLTPEQFEQLKKRVIDFRDEIQQSLQDTTRTGSMVAQINIQLFPVTKK